jgi:hypothetical protein
MTRLVRSVLCAAMTLGVSACPSPPRQFDTLDGEGGGDAFTDTWAEADDAGEDLDTRALSDRDALSGELSDAPHDADVIDPQAQCPGGCDDGLPCTRDLCLDGDCVHQPAPGSCDDGDPCTRRDYCADGLCIGEPLDCDDGEACTEDRCEVGQCVHTELSMPCDDANACTSGDTCSGGRCVGGLLRCDDGNPCTDDYCDPRSGCTTRDNRALCDDGNSCTVSDRCSAGLCVGAEVAECCEDGDCDDGDACTTDLCIEGRCEAREVACDDGDVCTFDACSDGVCEHESWGPFPAPSSSVDDFGGGLETWTVSSTNPMVGWSIDASAGNPRLYCGNPETRSYDHGPSLATASRSLAIPPQATHLTWFWEASLEEASCLYDSLVVVLENEEVARICESGAGVERIDVAPYAGREVSLFLRFDTRDELRNDGAGIWLDDLTLEGGDVPVCP